MARFNRDTRKVWLRNDRSRLSLALNVGKKPISRVCGRRSGVRLKVENWNDDRAAPFELWCFFRRHLAQLRKRILTV